MAGEVQLLDYVIQILSDWSQRTRTIFLSQKNCRKERSDFLSDQKWAQKNGFSLRFFV